MGTLSQEITLSFTFLPPLLIRVISLKKRICSKRSKFFALRVDPISKGYVVEVKWKTYK